MRPRTGLGVGIEAALDDGSVGGSSRMQTAALLERPEPRRIAGRPVDWMVDIMVEGGVVPVVVSMEVGREKDVDCIPR